MHTRVLCSTFIALVAVHVHARPIVSPGAAVRDADTSALLETRGENARVVEARQTELELQFEEQARIQAANLASSLVNVSSNLRAKRYAA
jgi:hypothetical protein